MAQCYLTRAGGRRSDAGDQLMNLTCKIHSWEKICEVAIIREHDAIAVWPGMLEEITEKPQNKFYLRLQSCTFYTFY